MDVNTQYNLITLKESQPDFSKTSTEKVSEAITEEQFKTAYEARQAKADAKVMMDLKDVQSFLYMMIGSAIKVSEEDRVPGTVPHYSLYIVISIII